MEKLTIYLSIIAFTTIMYVLSVLFLKIPLAGLSWLLEKHTWKYPVELPIVVRPWLLYTLYNCTLYINRATCLPCLETDLIYVCYFSYNVPCKSRLQDILCGTLLVVVFWHSEIISTHFNELNILQNHRDRCAAILLTSIQWNIATIIKAGDKFYQDAQ